MARSSPQRKVSKAARTGGGRTSRAGTRGSWLYPGLLTVVVVVGVFLVGFSRQQRQPDTSPPRIGDHWHAAIGFDVCGSFLDPLASTGRGVLGIHTHNDGLVHVEPTTDLATGERAVLQLFLDDVGVTATVDTLTLPGQEARANGDLCGDAPGVVKVMTWDGRGPDVEGVPYTGDPGDLRIRNDQLITVAFVPEDEDVPRPPSETALEDPNAGESSSPPTTNPSDQPPGSTEGDTATSVPAEGGDTATSVPAESGDATPGGEQPEPTPSSAGP